MNRIAWTHFSPSRLDPEDSSRLATLKRRIVQHLAWHQGAELPGSLVQRAVNEAESLAILTPHPALFLPVLAEEKLLNLRSWYRHQNEVLDKTQGFQSFAA